MLNYQVPCDTPSANGKGGDVCMIGGIYSDERCPVCGGSFKDDGRKSLYCPNHPAITARKMRVIFKGVHKRFNNYDKARQVLEGLRYKLSEGTFDSRDYRKDNPLGFSNIVERWLDTKKERLRLSSFNAIENHVKRAVLFFGDMNVKEIAFHNLEDFDLSLKGVSSKTRANIFSTLHSFLVWFQKRKYVKDYQLPEFPKIEIRMGYRNIIGKAEQLAVLDEVYRLVGKNNPKIWVGIKWLITYPAIRPGELSRIREIDFDLSNGLLRIPDPKEKRYKIIPLIDEDVEIVKSFVDPKVDTRLLRFFRHPSGIKGAVEGHPFNKNIFYYTWKKAASNLNIKDVDLYGGTKHSTITALNQEYSPEEIKRGAQISTNKAFDRYLQLSPDERRKLYEKARGSGKELAKVLMTFQKDKPL